MGRLTIKNYKRIEDETKGVITIKEKDDYYEMMYHW